MCLFAMAIRILTLSLFMSWIGFANYINIALSTDYAALCTHFSNRRLNFHNKTAFYPKPIYLSTIERPQYPPRAFY